MKFVKHDAGRSESKRKKQYNDCTVVAIATTSGLPYDEVYDMLKHFGRRSGHGFHITYLLSVARIKNQIFITRVADKNWNIYSFLDHFPKGKFIVVTKSHCYAVINGTAYDHTEPCGDDELKYYIEVKKATKLAKQNHKCIYKIFKDAIKKKPKKTRHPSYEIHLCSDGLWDGEYDVGGSGDPDWIHTNTFDQALKAVEKQIEKEPRRSLFIFELDSSISSWEERSWCYVNHNEKEEHGFYNGHTQEWEKQSDKVKRYLNKRAKGPKGE